MRLFEGCKAIRGLRDVKLSEDLLEGLPQMITDDKIFSK